MRGAHLHRSARISRGREIARTQGQRRKLDAENEWSDLERRLSAIPLRFSRGPSVQRRLSSRRHGVGFTRCEPRPSGTTNQRRNTACSRSLKKRRTRAPAQLRATDRDQGGQHGRAAPLNALLRYGRRGVTKSPHDTGAPAVPASLRSMWCAVASLQARQPCGPLRSVTLAGCASGGSRLRATVGFG